MTKSAPRPLEMPLWLQLNKVSKKAMDALAARLGHIGIRRHYFLLLAIHEGKGVTTQQELADLIEVDKVAMVGILDSLEKAGFIVRTQSKDDRRKHRIALTPKAVRHLPKIRKVIAELNARALAGLPREFADQFLPSLVRIKAELEKAILEADPADSVSDAPRQGRKPRKIPSRR